MFNKFIAVIVAFFYLATSAGAATINFEYDQAGNMVSGQGKYYEYNAANQLVKVRKDAPSGPVIAEYVYDYQGQRVKKIENGITTYYIGKHYEERKGNTVNEKTNYIFVNGQRVAARIVKDNEPAKVSYYLNNHLGSADVVTDAQGNVTERLRYYPYGEYRTQPNPKERHAYTGKERDEATEEYYYEARYYNPGIRRFTQADTVTPNLYDPQSLNRYAYVRNNPVKYIDPTGHAECQCRTGGPTKYVCHEKGKEVNVVSYQDFLDATAGKTLSDLRNSIRDAPYRNVLDPQDNSTIDMQHFLIVGQYGSGRTENVDFFAGAYNISGSISDLDNSTIGVAARKHFGGATWKDATFVADIGLESYQKIVGEGGTAAYKTLKWTPLGFALNKAGILPNEAPGFFVGNRNSAFSTSDIPSDIKGRVWYRDYKPIENNWQNSFRNYFQNR